MNPSDDDLNLRVSHLEGRADYVDARLDRITEILNQAAEIGLKNSMEITAFREAMGQQARDNQDQHEASRREFDEDMRQIKQTMRDLAESQRHGDESLNALIHMVDDLIRKRPPLQ
jgi:chromosome segregation ATPase